MPNVRPVGWLLILACLFWLGVAATLAHGAGIPRNAYTHKTELVRQARLVWGLNAPIAVMAAQVHQESAWNESAISWVGAKGLAQFMPATAKWIPTIDSQLINPEPTNPKWALRALARYDYWLYSRLRADTDCDRWAMTLSAYNGGLGWVLRDKKAANAAGKSRWLWWDNVERFNAGRGAAQFRENRHYPKRILKELTPRYVKASWGLGICTHD